MHFWDIVQDFEGYLLPSRVLSHLYGNVDMMA